MRKLLLSLSLMAVSPMLWAQPTVAMDFDANDCYGTNHHLFADLEAGQVVILEFFMLNCGSCITAGNHLEAVKTTLNKEFPGKVKSYAIGFQDSYSCANIKNWVETYNFTSIPMDKGAAQTAYYGGMGMPTVVVLGGNNHDVLGKPFIGFSANDTVKIGSDVRAFLGGSLKTEELNKNEMGMLLFPNPVQGLLQVNFSTIGNESVQLSILDLSGREIKNFGAFQVESGRMQESLNLNGLSAGSYILQAKTSNLQQSQRLVIN